MEERLICLICGVFLPEPYIKCAACINPQRYLCVQCFAKGREYGSHKNDHPYIIVRNNFSLFDPEWMASEEVKLLNAVADYGIGNWPRVARDTGTKNRQECKEHYFKYYVNNPVPPLPEFPMLEAVSEVHPNPISCSSFSQDPPRPIIGSVFYQEMAGYMPGRGDFATEYDDYAELDIQDLSFDTDDPLWNDLQKAVLSIYQSRLKERARRKWIILNYGLISMKRNIEDWKRYTPLGSTILDKMKTFMHLFTPEDFYKFLEGVLWEEKLKRRIKMLQDCRRAGLTRLSSIGIYMQLKRHRDERQRSKSVLDEVLAQIKDETSCNQFIRRQVFKENTHGSSDLVPSLVNRRIAPPLNIAGMPGFDKLSSKEREVCASLRLLPTSFLQYKATLVNEYRKMGSLRLANARNVIKIDVNKTRRIYDLLIEQGLISKGS